MSDLEQSQPTQSKNWLARLPPEEQERLSNQPAGGQQLPAQSQPIETGHEWCVWQADDEGTYETSCGQAFVFTCDGPRENGARFCMYCGKPLEARAYAE